jgi:hypothetical protein
MIVKVTDEYGLCESDTLSSASQPAVGEKRGSMRVVVTLGAAALVAAIGAACTTADPTPNLTPVVVTPPTKTEVFNGTVGVGQSAAFPFTVTNVGNLSITLTAAGPPPTIAMQLGVGQPQIDGSCGLFINGVITTAPGTTPQLGGSQISAGSYCVSITDVGNATSAVTFSITVMHT